MNKKGNLLRLIIALILTIILIAPIYFIFIYGFQSVNEIYHIPPYFVPPHFNFDYYAEAWNGLEPYFINSIIISLGTLMLTLIVAVPASFALSIFKLKTNNFFDFLLAFVQFLPAAAVVIPMFLIFYHMRLSNTYFGDMLGIASITIPFSSLLLISYMRSEIPYELIESAQLDGANLLIIFTRIVIPLSRNSIITSGLLSFLMAWGDFIFSLSLLQSNNLQPISVGLYTFIGAYGVQWNLIMAGGMLYSIIPIIAVLIGGRYLTSGLTAGALKG